MNFIRTLLTTATLAAAATLAHAQAPANLSGSFFNATVNSTTGGAIGGTFSNFLAANGIDYSVSGGSLSDPAPYTYAKTSDTAGTLTEDGVSVALTFTSATAGSFVATYTAGGTQTGTFALTAITATSPLVNASTRTTLVANGSAITGIVIGGTGPRRVLIRAVGPGLTDFGVTSAIANPYMMLWSGNMEVGNNDDWESDPAKVAELNAVSTQVGAFALKTGSKDAAVVATLNPGAYTAVIRGSTAADAGEVLFEVYFVD